MNEGIRRKKQEIINKKIYEKYNNLGCITIVNVKEKNNVDETFTNVLDEIRNVEYNKLFTIKKQDNFNEYVDYLYEKLNLEKNRFRWLIPGFGGGTEWYEIIVNDLEQFFKYYSEGGVLNDFAVIDLENRIVFEIEQMEKDLDYYIKRL